MKKIVSVLLLICMLLSVFAMAGCQSGSGNKVLLSNFEIPEGGYDGSEVTITFYHTRGSNLTDVLNIYIQEFNKLYPNIHIEHSQVGAHGVVEGDGDSAAVIATLGNLEIANCGLASLGSLGLGGVGAVAAGNQTQHHDQSQCECNDSLHSFSFSFLVCGCLCYRRFSVY